MFYDLSLISNPEDVNSLVVQLRSFDSVKQQYSFLIKQVSGLVRFLNLETCKRILDGCESFDYIPYNGREYLTAKHISDVVQIPQYEFSRGISSAPGEKIKVSYRDLFCLATKVDGVEIASENRAVTASSTLEFRNGTVFRNTSPRYMLLDPKAVLYRLVTSARKFSQCNRFVAAVWNVAFEREAWCQTGSIVDSNAQEVDRAVETIVDIIQEPKSVLNPEPTGVEAVEVAEAKPAGKPAKKVHRRKTTQPQTAKVPVLETVEESFVRFLNALRPGTTIQITIPG